MLKPVKLVLAAIGLAILCILPASLAFMILLASGNMSHKDEKSNIRRKRIESESGKLPNPEISDPEALLTFRTDPHLDTADISDFWQSQLMPKLSPRCQNLLAKSSITIAEEMGSDSITMLMVCSEKTYFTVPNIGLDEMLTLFRILSESFKIRAAIVIDPEVEISANIAEPLTHGKKEIARWIVSTKSRKEI